MEKKNLRENNNNNYYNTHYVKSTEKKRQFKVSHVRTQNTLWVVGNLTFRKKISIFMKSVLNDHKEHLKVYKKKANKKVYIQ